MKRAHSQDPPSAAARPYRPLQPELQESTPLMGHDSLKALSVAPGPFVTVFLPARHPGVPDLSRAERLKTILRDAGLELKTRRFLGNIDLLLKPFTRLAADPGMLTGGTDSVIFGSPAIFQHLRILSPTPERLVVASHPCITPVLSYLIPQREFYVLAISKKLLRLGRWYDSTCTEVPLPADVPKSFQESLKLDQPDHDLQNHSRAGATAAHAGFTRFGTGSERDLVHQRLHHYLQLVDRELAGSLQNAPLVLVGTAEELAAYRAVSGYPRILSAKPTSPEYLSWVELGQRAQEAVMSARREEAGTVLGEFRDTARRDRVISGLRRVLEAARAGRVHRLLLETGAEHTGLLGPAFPIEAMGVEGEQDLINAAAVETIRGRGDVYMLDPGALREAGPIAAILRYAE